MGAKRLHPEIKESSEELKKLLRGAHDIKTKERIRLLYLIKVENITENKELAKIIGRTKGTITIWLKKYMKEGLEGYLKDSDTPKKISQINGEILELLKKRLSNEGFDSYQEIVDWIKEEFHLEVSFWTVYHTVHRKLKASPKVVRPSHYKQDKKKL